VGVLLVAIPAIAVFGNRFLVLLVFYAILVTVEPKTIVRDKGDVSFKHRILIPDLYLHLVMAFIPEVA